MEGMRPLWSIKRLISGSSWTGVSYTRVSTIDPLLEPKDTLEEKKKWYIYIFFFKKIVILRNILDLCLTYIQYLQNYEKIEKDFLDLKMS